MNGIQTPNYLANFIGIQYAYVFSWNTYGGNLVVEYRRTLKNVNHILAFGFFSRLRGMKLCGPEANI